MLPRSTIIAFDQFLVAKNLSMKAVVIGGAALSLLHVIDRPTRDFDILHPDLSGEIIHAAQLFAVEMRRSGVELADDWLNNGPGDLTDLLPDGWATRLQPVFEGDALKLNTLGRSDLLLTKLFALCDRGTDLQDCVALAPSFQELKVAQPWIIQQDTNPMWSQHVQDTLVDLGRRLEHGV